MQPGRLDPLTPCTDPQKGPCSDICPGRERGHVQLQELGQWSPGEDLLRPGTWEPRLGQGPGRTCILLAPAEPRAGGFPHGETSHLRPLSGRPRPGGPSREHGSFHVHSGDPLRWRGVVITPGFNALYLPPLPPGHPTLDSKTAPPQTWSHILGGRGWWRGEAGGSPGPGTSWAHKAQATCSVAGTRASSVWSRGSQEA